ncbi:hypothetical protein [Shewanella fodinae]|uniref:hypothetical protein n=1 Tax=Shewanella fodinae TaxID=552357 RepID=UPI001056B630|nr:hypothetical protein [Shewanella fodinae]
MAGDAIGDISRGEVPSVDTDKAMMKGMEGAATGLAASVPAIAVGPSIATEAVGTAGRDRTF